MKNYYDILQIDRTATEEDIKKAFRELAMKWHPDRNSSANAHQVFIEINEAYEILSNRMKRQAYDHIYFERMDVANYHEFFKWQAEAKNRANTYAEMDFIKFKERILDEIKVVVKHGSSLGCLTFVLLGVLVGIWIIIKSAVEGNGDLALAGVLSLLIYGGLSIWLFPGITEDYKNDRRNIKNNS